MQILARDSIVNCVSHFSVKGGQQPVVVFLHGWGRTLDDFDNIRERLSRSLSGAGFLQIDLPGFGGSPLRDEKGFFLNDYVSILKSLFEKLAIGRVVLVGHSFGGRVAIKFAAVFPEKVSRVVLIASAGIPQKSVRTHLLYIGRGIFRSIFFAFENLPFIFKLKNLLGAFFGSPDYRQTSGALRATFQKTFDEDLRPHAARIKAPTLIIWGRNDRETPLEDGEEFGAIITNSRLEVLEGGHFVFLDKPAETAGLIASFLKHA